MFYLLANITLGYNPEFVTKLFFIFVFYLVTYFILKELYGPDFFNENGFYFYSLITIDLVYAMKDAKQKKEINIPIYTDTEKSIQYSDNDSTISDFMNIDVDLSTDNMKDSIFSIEEPEEITSLANSEEMTDDNSSLFSKIKN